MSKKSFGDSTLVISPYDIMLMFSLEIFVGGHAKTLMFAHVSPEADSFGETVSTLKFAQRVSTVELGAARMNKETNEVMQLKAQVRIFTSKS